MAEARIHFTAPEKATLAVSAFAALTAAALTLFVERFMTALATLLFYPLMPGLIAGLLITGGHGGTAAQDAIAPFVAAFVNALFYFIAIMGFRLIWRRLAARSTK